jgi:tRNA(Ile2) C34 agmatinyltransferase TiaS
MKKQIKKLDGIVWGRIPMCCGKPMAPAGGNCWWCSRCNCTIEFC